MIFGIIITSVIHEEQKEGAVRTGGNEALLTNKSMIMITENIHHEMNTPLEVIDNKIQKIKMKMKKLDPLKLVQIEDDFEFIDTSSAQIRNILEKMKTFKNLRYSKKNQNIHKIFSNVFKMISMSSTNFEFSISDELKSVTINEDALTSSDLLNIGINHVKNSLEGGASKVYIIFEKIENDNLYIRIIDNGNGIAKNNQKKIFNPNFSTKSDFEGLRGNGMYLNKQIMNNAGGDIKLISSTKKGTTIGLNFHIKKQGVKNG
jgi:K+-sensing histidine kinase KdpD